MPRRRPSPRPLKIEIPRNAGRPSQGANADYRAWTESRPNSRAASISARSWSGCAKSSARRHHLQRRRQLPGLNSSLLPLPPFRQTRRAGLRLDGLWRAGRSSDEAALSRTDRHLHRRRRRFSDERAGIRDRRSIQFAVRHHRLPTTACTAPSACIRSANIPAASSATDLRNPDFAAYARAFGGFGVRSNGPRISPRRSRRRRPPASPPSCACDRSGSADAGHDAVEDPRKVAGGEGELSSMIRKSGYRFSEKIMLQRKIAI